jgi:hypothetical protein
MGAEIEVRNAVSIVGHGTVLIGYVRSGVPAAGQVTSPLRLAKAPERRLVLKSVQRLSSTEGGGPAVGLVFVQGPRLDDLRKALPSGSIVVLEDPDEAVEQPW